MIIQARNIKKIIDLVLCATTFFLSYLDLSLKSVSPCLLLNTDNRVMVGAKFKFKPYNCIFFCLLSPNLRVHVTTADVYRKMKQMTQECTCGRMDFWRISADGREGLNEIQS